MLYSKQSSHHLLPVVIAFLILGLLLGAGRSAAGRTADEVVAGFAVGLGLLVIGPAGFRGLQGILLGSSGSRGGSGSLGGCGRLLDLRRRGRVGVVIGIIVPLDFFLVDVDIYTTS